MKILQFKKYSFNVRHLVCVRITQDSILFRTINSDYLFEKGGKNDYTAEDQAELEENLKSFV